MPSAQTALMPLRRRLNAFIARCHAPIGSVCDPYRPGFTTCAGPVHVARQACPRYREQRVAREAASSSSSKKPGSRPGFSFIGACPDRGLRHRPVRLHRAVRR